MTGWGLLLMATALAARPVDNQASQRPLTLRAAERAIDRAFVAELAGDYDGGRRALVELLGSPARPEEASARARLTTWLVGLRARQEAFTLSGRTRHGYHQAFSTLRAFGHPRSDLLWAQAVRDVPSLRSTKRQSRTVQVRFERLRRVQPKDVLEGLRLRFEGAGFVAVEKAEGPTAYELRVNLDASRVVIRAARSHVTAEGSFLLRYRQDEQEQVASYARARTVARRTEEAARAFAVRRAVDDLAWAAIFRLRLARLGEADAD